MQVDVLIIGGGPAGSAVALTLLQQRPGLKVVMVEEGNYEQERVGESLPPTALDLLRTLGVASAFLRQGHLPAYGTCAAWGSEELYANEFIFQTNNQGWHLDRSGFDAFLAEEAQSCGASLLRNSKVKRWHNDGDQYTLHLQRGSETLNITTRFVVDASGRNAWWAKRQKTARIKADNLVGFCQFYHFPDQGVSDSYAMVEAWENGWWYSALLPGQRMIVVAMTDAPLAGCYALNSQEGWDVLLAKSQHTKNRLSGALPVGSQQVWAAASQRLEHTVGNRWLAVGDAAATLDPLSSQGIMHALHTGIFGGYAILDFFKGDHDGLKKYDRWMQETFATYLDTKASFYGEEQRWPHQPFWQKRHAVFLQNT